ncbi:MAG: hypothetical protein B0D92_02055 [Spirochaeta sp. LUC14_002_19_P3]|nr:MAG: hypothetical protein B0D92_02055 [Spirochaeta sp. LUC14_002_19_P3]
MESIRKTASQKRIKRTVLACLLLCAAAHVGAQSLELDLPTAIALSITASQEMKDGRFTLEAAEIQRRLAYQSLFPSLSVTLSDESSVVQNAADPRKSELTFALSQPVYLGGQVVNSLKLQQLKVEYGKGELLALTENLRQSCYSAYYSYIIQERKISNQEEILTSAREQLAISQKELELGKIREVDYLETELKVQAMASGLDEQRLALDEAAYNLRQLLGLSPDQPFTAADNLPKDYAGATLPVTSEQSASLALNANNQLQLSLLEIEQKNVEYKAAKSRWLPNIALEGKAKFSGSGYPLQNGEYSLGVNITFPLPWIAVSGTYALASNSQDSFTRTGAVNAKTPQNIAYGVNARTASLALDNAREKYQKLRNDLIFQVRITLNRFENMRQSLKMSRDQVNLLQRRLDILALEVEHGTSTRLDYVKAQNDYIEKVISLNEGILELLQTERALEILLGIPFNTLGQTEANNETDE